MTIKDRIPNHIRRMANRSLYRRKAAWQMKELCGSYRYHSGRGNVHT